MSHLDWKLAGLISRVKFHSAALLGNSQEVYDIAERKVHADGVYQAAAEMELIFQEIHAPKPPVSRAKGGKRGRSDAVSSDPQAGDDTPTAKKTVLNVEELSNNEEGEKP